MPPPPPRRALLVGRALVRAGGEPPHREQVDALLLIDGTPRWVWVGQEDVELL
jgi:hypothetical protein